jgi:hypothetical protein
VFWRLLPIAPDGVQGDADDQENDAKRDKCDQGLHLELSYPLHALVYPVMKDYATEA